MSHIFFQPNADIVVPWLVRLREWLPDGRLWFGDEWRWREKLATGVVRASALTMAEWFRHVIGVELETMDSLAYAPGAVFAVRRDLVHRRPRAYYESIIRTLMHHTSPEEAYFCEQAWMYMFAHQHARIQLLSVPANPNAVRP